MRNYKKTNPPTKKIVIVIIILAIIASVIVGRQFLKKSFLSILPDQNQQAMPTGQMITVIGESVCLPHRDENGPQTMECAFGLKDDSGKYYALRDSDPTYKNISSLPTSKKIQVTGKFTPQNNSPYQEIGIIEVSSVTPLRQ